MKIYSNEYNLGNPEETTSSNRFHCVSCGKRFTRYAYLIEHEKRHKREKDKKCPVLKPLCIVFIHFQLSQRHFIAQIIFFFQICNKLFYNTSFWRHMSVVHASQERLIYECEKCPKKFSQQFLLKNHQRSHLPYDERQYVCEKCPDERKFVDQNKLNAHIKAVYFK